MREIKIIAALGDVIGELVTDREAEPRRATVRRNDVQPDDLRLFAKVEREIRRDDRAAAPDQDVSVALVEPFWLRANATVRRPATFEPPLEHAHRVRNGRRILDLCLCL